MSFGKPAGAAMPRDTAHTSLKPCSRKVGPSGMNGERSADITPSTRNWPALMSSATSLTLQASTSILPASTWVLPSGVPRKWTIWKLVPVLAPMPSAAM